MAEESSVKQAALWACRLILGGIFAYAATAKLIDPTNFARDIEHYDLVPYPVAIIGSVFLPWLELLCGLAVMLRRCERGALVLLIGLCGLFACALASAWWRGLDINCGCFGHATASSSFVTAIARDLGLGAVAFFLLWNVVDPQKSP